jgi:transposase
MFIRKKKGQYKEKTYTNYQLVESLRTPEGPRQKVVCSLGNLKSRSRIEWLKLARKVEAALQGQLDLMEEYDEEVTDIVNKVHEQREKDRPEAKKTKETDGAPQSDDLVTVRTNGLKTELHREAGPVHVGYHYWNKLGLEAILTDLGFSRRERMLTCLMTMNRLFCPSSEHAMPDWIRSSALPDILGEDLDSLSDTSLYRNLDALHPKRAQIESRLADRERTLFDLDQTVFLYDLTSTYFEGQTKKNPKAKRGYSRDKRPDCNQVVVGLIVNRDGFPLGHEVFEGNIRDHKTVPTMLDLLDSRIGLKPGQTVVVDRGMSYDENISQITARGLHYLVASRQQERDQWLGEFEDLEGFYEIRLTSSPTNPYQKKAPIKVKMKITEQTTYVLCMSPGRKDKDKAIREKQELRLLDDLAKLEKRVREGRLVKADKIGEAIGRLKERYPRVARYYRIDHDAQGKKLSYPLIDNKHDVAERLDGSYLLKSDRKDLSAEEIWRTYNLLTKAEDAFRAMKSPLAERPIFHQLERRTETHIFLCILAYHLMVAIEKTLRDKGVHLSFATVRSKLKTHQVSTTVLPTEDGRVLKIRKDSTAEPEHRELYRLLEVPKKIIPPKKTWVDWTDDP